MRSFAAPSGDAVPNPQIQRLESLLQKTRGDIAAVRHLLLWQHQAQCAELVQNIVSRPEYADPLRLERFGYKAYSQNDEDGMVAEIFRRIGTTNRVFFEFGVGNGLENNTLHLLNQGWTGYWIDANASDAAQLREHFREPLESRRLQFTESFIDRDNINKLIEGFRVPDEIDLMSIDIDGNDYHVWEAIERIRPRVVIMEYNAKFPPPVRWVMRYDPKHVWDGSDQFGASLQSLTDLGEKKSYRLVGCSIVGGNAFFVRSDVAGNHFHSPATAENFYHPPRYYLTVGYFAGHPAAYGKGLPPDTHTP